MDTQTTGSETGGVRTAEQRQGRAAQPTREEAQHLFELAQRSTEIDRDSLYSAVADLFERREHELVDDERALMLDILRRLTVDVELAIRHELAGRLARKPSAPRDLVFMLANDRIDVCYDILAKSPVLRDSDLIEIIRNRGLAHQMGIAIREELSEDVSAVLVATGEEKVVVALLENQTARIARDTMRRIVGESEHIEAYHQPLVTRKDLPADLAHKLLMWVSVTLRNFIVRRFDIDAEMLDDEIVEATSEVAARDDVERRGLAQSPAERLVEKLHAAGELTPAFAVKALGQGQVALFELAFAKLRV